MYGKTIFKILPLCEVRMVRGYLNTLNTVFKKTINIYMMPPGDDLTYPKFNKPRNDM